METIDLKLKEMKTLLETRKLEVMRVRNHKLIQNDLVNMCTIMESGQKIVTQATITKINNSHIGKSSQVYNNLVLEKK